MAKHKPLYMETTMIPASKTAAEIIDCLVASGASHIGMEYDERRRLSGFRFIMQGPTGISIPFQLPVRVEPVFLILNKRRPTQRYRRSNREVGDTRDREQAERVAWRQLLRWVQAQAAMIETGMVESSEVFMPYADFGGRTLFERFKENGMKMLGSGKEG